MQNQPQYQQPYPQGQPQYAPPQPVKRSGGCMKLVAIGAVLFLGLIVVTCYFGSKRIEEVREQERVATEQADTAILASIEKAKTLYGEGKLKEAVRELEGAVRNSGGSNDVRMQAHRLLDEYGKEFGKQFEGEVASLLDKANTAINAGNADEAEKHLKAAVDIRYAPNVDAARKLLATLREARSEEKMKSFVVAMSDAEFEAFLNDLALPDRAAFEHSGLDAIFKAALKLNQDKAAEWRPAKAPKAEPPKSTPRPLGVSLAEVIKRLDDLYTAVGEDAYRWHFQGLSNMEMMAPDTAETSNYAGSTLTVYGPKEDLVRAEMRIQLDANTRGKIGFDDKMAQKFASASFAEFMQAVTGSDNHDNFGHGYWFDKWIDAGEGSLEYAGYSVLYSVDRERTAARTIRVLNVWVTAPTKGD